MIIKDHRGKARHVTNFNIICYPPFFLLILNIDLTMQRN